LKGRIFGFRRGSKTQNPNQVIVYVEGVDDVKKLIGFTTEYKDKYGNTYIGRVIRHHGKHEVRVVFVPNLPGQAPGDIVTLRPPSP